MWFEGTCHQYTSGGTKVKVICHGQDQILRSHFEKKWAVFFWGGGGDWCFTTTTRFIQKFSHPKWKTSEGENALYFLPCQRNLIYLYLFQIYHLTLYHTIPTFNDPDKEAF